MRRTYCLPVVALAAAAAGALAATARTPAAGPTWTDLQAIAADVERGLGECAAGVSARAAALAALAPLGLAVATDRATVGDMSAEELALRAGPDETIELGQTPRGGGAPASLRRFPSTRASLPLGSPGLHVIADDRPRVASVVRFRPRARADELDGVVAVSWPADMARVEARLAAFATGVSLETAGGSVALGGPVDAARGTVTMEVAGPQGSRMRLIAPAPTAADWGRGPLSVAAGILVGALAACVLICRAAARAPRPPRRQTDAASLSRTWTPPPPPSPCPPPRPSTERAGRWLPLPPPDWGGPGGPAGDRQGE